jgi:hypothetical protein
MKKREWNFVDKSKWGVGPWADEPDKVQWVDKKTGLPCLAVRHPSAGHWCGYVGVTPEHPLFGVGYSERSEKLEAALEARKQRSVGDNPGMGVLLALLSGEVEPTPDRALEVHGGITFADRCHGDPEGHTICHVAEAGEPEVFWFGFDCAHAGDLSPAYRTYFREPSPDRYRPLGYVRDECRKLAAQLKAIAGTVLESTEGAQRA